MVAALEASWTAALHPPEPAGTQPSPKHVPVPKASRRNAIPAKTLVTQRNEAFQPSSYVLLGPMRPTKGGSVKRLPAFFCSALVVCIGLRAATDPKRQATYTIGMEIHEDSFGFNAKFFEELISVFALKQNHKIKIVKRPIKRLTTEFLRGEFDLKYPDNPGWSQPEKKDIKIIYSNPIATFREGIFVKPSNLGKGLSRFKTLSAMLGFNPRIYMEYINKKSIKLIEPPNLQASLKVTLAGHADGTYMNVSVAPYILKDMGIPDALVFDPTLPYLTDNYYLSTMKHPELIKEFNLFLQKEQTLVTGLKLKYKQQYLQAGAPSPSAKHQGQ